jgi:hypothetical protein
MDGFLGDITTSAARNAEAAVAALHAARGELLGRLQDFLADIIDHKNIG